ncbi:hypothetical protein KY347_04180 [Candidatus Woesearchaeota archaeon]|nr:hypothetical protein [Candidatus Woesearchaeota archaeon]
METEYNWKAILLGAIPVSLIMALVFFSDISKGLKWLCLVLGIAGAAGITYYFDRKKHNIFTSAFIVVIAALAVYGLKNLGLV